MFLCLMLYLIIMLSWNRLGKNYPTPHRRMPSNEVHRHGPPRSIRYGAPIGICNVDSAPIGAGERIENQEYF
jgi:hypothetical protein